MTAPTWPAWSGTRSRRGYSGLFGIFLKARYPVKIRGPEDKA